VYSKSAVIGVYSKIQTMTALRFAICGYSKDSSSKQGL